MNTWISFSSKSGVREFEYYAKTFVRWKFEIINSFYSRYTNGCTEEINNLIKVIKRVSFGYSLGQRLFMSKEEYLNAVMFICHA